MSLKTRREFLKSVSHGVIPAFAALGLGISLGGCGDDSDEKSCKDCSGSCSGTSSGDSGDDDSDDCGSSCSGLCSDSCPGACGDACATSCSDGCWGSGV